MFDVMKIEYWVMKIYDFNVLFDYVENKFLLLKI